MNTNQSAASHGMPFSIGGRRLAILLIAWLSLFAGIQSIPVEDHEALVLQTSREMSERGDWVLPYFNGEARLKKPPLNYWITMTIARLDPFSADIEPWHGRVSSMLGGLILLVVIAYAGGRLHDGQAGFLAALLLLGTKGFADYSHHARPDFLYSVLCALQLAAWIGAWQAKDGSFSQWRRAGLGWVLAGLATLTKGPQVPAIFLLGLLLFLLCGEDRRRTPKVLRPFSGLPILLALCLPWWWLLQQRLRTTGIDLGETQLSGSLLKSLASWREVLSFYYVFELLRLLLPVCLILPPLIAWNWRKFAKPRGVERLLVYVTGATLVVFTLAGHYRPHYMLPLLPVLAVLLAGWISRIEGHSMPQKVWRVFLGIGVAGLVVCAGLLVREQQYGSAILLSLTSGALGFLLRKEAGKAVSSERPLFQQLIAASILCCLLFSGFNALPSRNESREQNRNFAVSIGRAVTAGDYLATWRTALDIVPYYARHQVVRIQDLDELRARFEQKGSGQNVYVVTLQKEIPALGRRFELSVLETKENTRKPGKSLVFAKILNLRSPG